MMNLNENSDTIYVQKSVIELKKRKKEKKKKRGYFFDFFCFFKSYRSLHLGYKPGTNSH